MLSLMPLMTINPNYDKLYTYINVTDAINAANAIINDDSS